MQLAEILNPTTPVPHIRIGIRREYAVPVWRLVHRQSRRIGHGLTTELIHSCSLVKAECKDLLTLVTTDLAEHPFQTNCYAV